MRAPSEDLLAQYLSELDVLNQTADSNTHTPAEPSLRSTPLLSLLDYFVPLEVPPQQEGVGANLSPRWQQSVDHKVAQNVLSSFLKGAHVGGELSDKGWAGRGGDGAPGGAHEIGTLKKDKLNRGWMLGVVGA